MPIELRCSQCGQLLRVPDEAAGKTARCPECGAVSAVPSTDATAGSPFAADVASQPTGESEFVEPMPVESDNPYQAPSQYGQPAYAPPPRRETGAAAVISLVLGCCGFPAMCLCGFFAVPIAIVGIVLGTAGLKTESRGIAIGGIVLCSLQIALVLMGLAFLAFVMMADFQAQ